jgi:hypothetical protein
MASHDVTLAINQRPKFSNRCVVCEQENPTATANVKILGATSAHSWESDVVDLTLGINPTPRSNSIVTLLVPACPRCAKKLSSWHILLITAKYLGALLGVAIGGFFLFKGLSFLFWVALLLGIVLPVIYELLYPPSLGATVKGNQIIYEFQSLTCAEEFAQLNVKA